MFHGFIGDDPVLVYDFNQHPDGKIGLEFVEDLSGLCGGRLGERCFIIAPATTVEPYEDYITIGDTKFFFLRIPYSIIAELHKKAFSELRQPRSQATMNAPIDAVGFDFIQPPRVDCIYYENPESYCVEVADFESEAFAASDSRQDRSDLAMILVDHSYDGEIFNLCSVYFADDLSRSKWTVKIPKSAAGEQLMIIYVDVFGNEHREVRAVDRFIDHPILDAG